MQEHIVKKIAFNVEIGQQERPEHVRSVLLEKIQNVIQFELAEIMDEYTHIDETIQIDFLELDLGEVTLENIDEAVLKSFKRQLESQLKTRGFNSVHQKANSTDSTGNDKTSLIDQKKIKEVGLSLEDSEQSLNSGIISNSQRKFEGILDFLESGIISWWNPLKSMNEMEYFLKGLLETNNQANSHLQRNTLIQAFKSKRRVRERLSYNFSKELFIQILAYTFEKKPNIIKELILQVESTCQILSLDSIPKEARTKIIHFVLLESLLIQSKSLPSISKLSFLTLKQSSANRLIGVNEKLVREKLYLLFLVFSEFNAEGLVDLKKIKLKTIKGLDKKVLKILNEFIQSPIKLSSTQIEKLISSVIREFYGVEPTIFIKDLVALSKVKQSKDLRKPQIENKKSTRNRFTKSIEDEINKQFGADKVIPIQTIKAETNPELQLDESLDEKFRKYIDQFKSNAAEIQKEKELNQPKDKLAKGQSIQSFEKDKLTKKFELLRKKREEKLREETMYLEKMRKENERLESMKEEKIQSETAYFNFAGIVIIWSLIVPLFDDRQLLENRNFKDEEARFKGLQMLNYLVNGDEIVEEKDMPLNKILCGIPRNEPVIFTSDLTEDDILELNALLAHLIKHWSILKNTSIQGLRDGFIHRKGQLAENEIEWSLKVEQKSIDLLMNSMPWGYKMIKLPWMNKLLIVEW